jgi:predicted Zn-dependent protease
LATLLAGYGRLDEAIVLWQKTVQLDPHYRTAKLKLAEALLKTNRLDESRKIYGEVLAQDPSEPYASLGLAQIEIQDGRWAAAREHLESAVAADPLFSAGWALLATVDDRLGDAAASDQAREKANVLGRFKDVPDPWMDELVSDIYDTYRLQVIASTISATGGAEKAIPILQRAIEVAPNDSRPHRQLGKLEVALHQNDQARTEFEKAIALQPHDPFAYIDLVGLYRTSGDVNGALRLLGDAVKNCPSAEGVQLEMGLALMAAGRVSEALPYLQKAVELAPDNPTNYEELAKAQFRLDDKAGGAETLKVGLARAPENAGLLAMRARYKVELGDEAGAEKDFRRAQKADPNEPMLAQVAEAFEKKFGRRVD